MRNMRNVEMTEVTNLLKEEEELSSLRETQYTLNMFKNDLINWIRIDKWNKEQWMLSFYVIVLIISSACERVIFKATIDGMEPFRAVLLILILLTSLIAFAVIAVVKRLVYKDMSLSNIFPDRKLIIMALFDTLSFGGLVISATGVTPTMTVILMHANTPLIVLGSKYLFPERMYSTLQIAGVCLISIALLISISHSIFTFLGIFGYNNISSHDPQYSSAICTILYLSSAAVQSVGALYKEKAIIEFSQPCDIHVMSCWLFFYQFLYSLIGYPLFYVLQGISSDWKGYPISSFMDNFWDGIYCLFGSDPNPSLSEYDISHSPTCVILFWLILFYVISTILILYCVEKILVMNNLILGNAMAFAVMISFFLAWIYDKYFSITSGEISNSSSINSFVDIISIGILLVGMIIFSKDPEPDTELTTNYSPINKA